MSEHSHDQHDHTHGLQGHEHDTHGHGHGDGDDAHGHEDEARVPGGVAEAPQRVHRGEVVLDIGDDTGGLIVYTTGELRGEEIEVFPVGDAAHKTHTDVQERQFQGRTIFTAVFTPLPIGEYRVSRPSGRAGEAITIAAGRVTEVDWRR